MGARCLTKAEWTQLRVIRTVATLAGTSSALAVVCGSAARAGDSEESSVWYRGEKEFKGRTSSSERKSKPLFDELFNR